ncbi:MAG: hypothetical protein GWN77_02110 [Gammaproteobacteria bacterium]|nr:hypothetical protein [Gammaproteobacteria bacterium]
MEGEPAYLYARGNPVNLIDPTGQVPAFPEHCRQRQSKEDYAWCVLGYYNLKYTAEPPEGYGFTHFIVNVDDVEGTPGCWQGPVPYLAGGYAEGMSWGSGPDRFGEEVTYDWATMERQLYEYSGTGFSVDSVTGVVIANASTYASAIGGFRSNKSIEDEYSGEVVYFTNGASIGPIPPPFNLSIGTGVVYFASPDFKIVGASWYVGGAAGVDIIPVLDFEGGRVNYKRKDDPYPYVAKQKRSKVKVSELVYDILHGVDSPAPFSPPALLFNIPATAIATKQAKLHDEIYVYSYSRGGFSSSSGSYD